MGKFIPKIRTTKELLRDIETKCKKSRAAKHNHTVVSADDDDFYEVNIPIEEFTIQPIGVFIKIDYTESGA